MTVPLASALCQASTDGQLSRSLSLGDGNR